MVDKFNGCTKCHNYCFTCKWKSDWSNCIDIVASKTCTHDSTPLNMRPNILPLRKKNYTLSKPLIFCKTIASLFSCITRQLDLSAIRFSYATYPKDWTENEVNIWLAVDVTQLRPNDFHFFHLHVIYYSLYWYSFRRHNLFPREIYFPS